MKRILLLLIALVTAPALHAGITTFTSIKQGTGIAANAVIDVEDDKYVYMTTLPGSNTWNSEFYNKAYNNRVSLKYLGALGTHYTYSWNVSVVFTIEQWSSLGTSMGTQTGTVTVTYDPGAQTTYTNNSMFRITGGGKTQVTINSVNTSTSPVTPGFTLPNDLILESEIEVERYYLNMQSTVPTVGHTTTSINTMTIHWSFVPGAEEYDLEWLFISNYDTQKKTAYATAPDFTHATRITTTQQSYTINLAYDPGVIMYRVRGVGRMSNSNNFDLRAEGTWSNTSAQVAVNNYSDDRNWTYSATYSEEGKVKEVVSFFDGSQRNRQAVTRLSTEDVSIIAENIYDYEGRPAIQTLPAPYEKRIQEWSTTLNFHTGMSLNPGGGIYSRKDFDKDALWSNCTPSMPPGMKDSQGASFYYSNQNDFVQEGYYSALPDANDFPFVQTVYGPDGQVVRQSMPGKDHAIGATGQHETRYYYVTPQQVELDRIFGNEAGNALHYSKKAVMDANGQISVAYTDLAGKTVATALAGNAPINMDALNSVATQAVTANLHDMNVWSPEDEAMVSTSNFLVTNVPCTASFSYSLTPEQLDRLCMSTTFDCVYDLLITVFDECNQPIDDNANPHIVHNVQTINGANHLITPYTVAFSVIFPRTGTYTISKKLSLNQDAVNAAVALHASALPGTCIPSLASFENDYLGTHDNTECQTCEEACSTIAYALGLSGEHFNEYVRNCRAEKCVDPEVTDAFCNVLLQHLKDDLSPLGQYFEDVPGGLTSAPAQPDYDWLEDNIAQPGNLVWWSNFTSWVASNCANAVTLANWDDVRNNWQDCYVDYYVNMHPEYCHYTVCTLTADSRVFDLNAYQNSTYAWATQHPTAGTPYISTGNNPIGLNMLNLDPCFAAGGYCVNDYGTATTGMLGQLNNYNGTGSTMWAHAGTVATNNDEQWIVFRQLYMQQKYEFIRNRKQVNGCFHLVDNSTPPDNIASGPICSNLVPQPCNPANASGFYIREPDYNDPLNTFNTAAEFEDFGDDLNSVYNICKTPAYVDYAITDGFTTVSAPVAIKVTSALYGFTNLDITGGGCCTGSYTAGSAGTTMAASLVDAINNYISNPDFTAELLAPSGTTGKIRIYALPYYGADANGNITASISGDPCSPECINPVTNNTFDNGSNTGECEGPGNCFCIMLEQLEYLWNNIDPLTNTYYIDHAAYNNDINNYIEASFDENYPSAGITYAQVSAWRSNCTNTGGTNPERYEDGATTPVPAAIDCDQEPDCDDFEDAQDIIGWSALQAYNNSVLAEMAGFLQDYKKQCFITGNFSETFTMDYTIKEYHYTLYFYDQAGNLERTVPPAGVQYIGTTGNPTFQNVTDYRKGAPGSTFSVPAHRYVTSYEYNSLNQLTEQVTPDAGTTAFWYDAIGKLRFSQNAKQQPFGRYSYTKYDLLGRIREVGESNVLYNATPFYNGKDDADFPQLQDFRQQVTYTYYDDFLSAGINGLFSGGQKNLRSRVTSVTLEAVGDQDHTTYDHASHYSYDIHGNVHHLIQDNPTLVDLGQRYKSLKYKYDLVSGNVNEVQYQPGDADQYYHRYWYDADNRITNVWTSRDGQIWDQDAKYYYYLHGPLARTETGHEKVQAMDYAYTVHGWIKGVNSNILDNTKDIGKDGVDDAGTGSYIPGKPGLHKGFAKDAMGYTLAYYRNATEADYTPIASGLTTFYDGTNSLNITGNDLYNGNIKAMAVALMKPVVSSAPVAMGLVDNHYRYDQLNRIMNANRYLTTSATSYAAAVNNNDYREEFTYDANGNIMSLLRKGTTQNSNVLDMDDLDYFYYTQSGGTFNPQTTAPPSDATNKLAYVDDDPLFTGNYTIDIDDQASLNYEYDEIGNLKKDVQEEIANIEWNVYGKIMKVTRTGNNHNKPDLEFAYDPMGNRIMKILKPRTGGVLSNQVDWTYTYYVRDAQGNVMAVYERTYDPEGGNNYSEQYDLKEKHIYGSSRLGMCTETVTIMEATFTSTGFTNNVFNTPTNYVAVNPPMGSGTDFLRTLGQKEYELGNHLGNILVTLSDRKLSIDGNTDDVTDHYLADVLSQNDYYAFGMQMPERSNLAGGFRYGFNGKEKDDEVKGSGNSYDFGARIYDSRLGRWLSVDPLTKDFPDESPYTFATNNPLYYVDPDGKKSYTYLTIIDKDGKETKMTIVNENETKDFQRYNYFWDDGSTYTEKWDFSQSVTIDYSKGKKPVVTTSEKHLIKRVDWRAVLKEKVFPFDGIAMSSKSGQGGGPPGKGYGRILNVDDLVSLLGGAGTSRTTNLPTTSVPNKYGATIDLIVKNLDNFLDTHGNFKDAFESMGGPWEPNKKTPGDTVCTNCNTEGNHGFGYKVYKEGKVVFEKNEEGGTETQTKSQPQSQEK